MSIMNTAMGAPPAAEGSGSADQHGHGPLHPGQMFQNSQPTSRSGRDRRSDYTPLTWDFARPSQKRSRISPNPFQTPWRSSP